jgi:serine/threonine-protein kinase HipA
VAQRSVGSAGPGPTIRPARAAPNQADPGARLQKATVLESAASLPLVTERRHAPARTQGHRRTPACQALGVPPALKYEADGGPGAGALVALLREHSRSADEDIYVFVQALILNWLIAGTDAHAKNNSILIGNEGRARLAPLYDVASALPCRDPSPQKLKLAMKVGGKYRLRGIGPHQWAKLASDLKLETDRVMDHVRRISGAIPDLSRDVLERTQADGLEDPMLARLATALGRRAKECAAAL